MNPTIDWHAFAPDIVLVATILVILVADLLFPNRTAWQTSRIAAIGVLGALIPIVTLAVDGGNRTMFGGAYVVDNYALALKGFFIVVTYIVILLSVDYINEGDYYQGEFYFLLLIVALGIFPNLIFRVTDDAVSCQTAAPFVSKTTTPVSPSLKCPAAPATAQVTVKLTANGSGG